MRGAQSFTIFCKVSQHERGRKGIFQQLRHARALLSQGDGREGPRSGPKKHRFRQKVQERSTLVQGRSILVESRNRNVAFLREGHGVNCVIQQPKKRVPCSPHIGSRSEAFATDLELLHAERDVDCLPLVEVLLELLCRVDP